jgi:hypothetical protein
VSVPVEPCGSPVSWAATRKVRTVGPVPVQTYIADSWLGQMRRDARPAERLAWPARRAVEVQGNLELRKIIRKLVRAPQSKSGKDKQGVRSSRTLRKPGVLGSDPQGRSAQSPVQTYIADSWLGQMRRDARPAERLAWPARRAVEVQGNLELRKIIRKLVRTPQPRPGKDNNNRELSPRGIEIGISYPIGRGSSGSHRSTGRG